MQGPLAGYLTGGRATQNPKAEVLHSVIDSQLGQGIENALKIQFSMYSELYK